MDNFIDDIGAIRVGGGLVRIQTIRRMQDDKGEQRAQERGDLVLPITSFLRMHAGLNKAVDEMLEKGILKRREEGENAEADVVDTEAAN